MKRILQQMDIDIRRISSRGEAQPGPQGCGKLGNTVVCEAVGRILGGVAKVGGKGEINSGKFHTNASPDSVTWWFSTELRRRKVDTAFGQ